MFSTRGLRVCLGSGVIKVASRRSQEWVLEPGIPGRPGIAGAEPRIIVQRHAVWNSNLPILLRLKWERG